MDLCMSDMLQWSLNLSSSVVGIAFLPQLCCQAKALGRLRQRRHQVPHPCYVLRHKVPSPLRSFFSFPFDNSVLKEALLVALYVPQQYNPQLTLLILSHPWRFRQHLIFFLGCISWSGVQESCCVAPSEPLNLILSYMGDGLGKPRSLGPGCSLREIFLPALKVPCIGQNYLLQHWLW